MTREAPDEREQRNKTAGPPLVTAAEWFAGGQRIGYDPESARVLTEEEAAGPRAPCGSSSASRPRGRTPMQDTVWLTMLPGFPDGSYGWAQVDRMLGGDLSPRLYAEPVGQGDSDKPRDYRYSTVERADLVQALWRHHGVRAHRRRHVRLHLAGAARAAPPPAGRDHGPRR